MRNNLLHIIYLKDRTDRRISVLKELELQNITNYVFWEGFIDNQKPSRGIAMAHQQIVQWAKEEHLPEVMIAEDDIKFTSKGAMDWYLQNEPEEYDLYLGGIIYGEILPDNSVQDFSGTHLYKVRNRFYDHLLSLSGDIDIDRALAGSGKFIICNPMVAFQADGYSNNSKRYSRYAVYKRNRNWFNEKF